MRTPSLARPVLARSVLAGPVLAGLALSSMMLSGCSSGDTVAPAQHAPEIAAPTIVSLNPCTDAILHEIAAPGQLLAVSHYSHDAAATSMVLDEARAYPATGGTAEEVLAHDPDIVVSGPFLSLATKAALQKAGVDVVQIEMAASLEDSLAQIAQLGDVTGEPERAAALADMISSRWDAASVAEPQISTLLWQEGGIVAGTDSLAFHLLDHTGFTSHSAARGLGQGEYVPLEHVMADPPELILAGGDERMLSHPVLRALDDVAYDVFDMNLLYCAGPTIPRAIDRLIAIRASLLTGVQQGEKREPGI